MDFILIFLSQSFFKTNPLQFKVIVVAIIRGWVQNNVK